MIISFAWTTLAVIANHYDPPGKTETRRDWSPKTIAQFQKRIGQKVDAWDKSPRFLQSGNASKAAKSVAGSALSQRQPKKGK